jgi:hypothetical protein
MKEENLLWATLTASADWRDRETLMLLIEPFRELCGMNHARTKTLWKQGRKKLESEY